MSEFWTTDQDVLELLKWIEHGMAYHQYCQSCGKEFAVINWDDKTEVVELSFNGYFYCPKCK